MSGKEGEDQDAERRRNEINMFAAMALGGGDAVTADDDDGPPTTTTASSSSGNAPPTTSTTTSTDYDSGSLQFSASSSASSSRAPPTPPPPPPPPPKLEANQSSYMAAFAAAAGGDPDSIQQREKNMFSQAALNGSDHNTATNIVDSGTFAKAPAFQSGTFNTTSSTSTFGGGNQNNLHNAAAALAIGDSDEDDDDEETVDNMLMGFGGNSSRLSAVLPLPKAADAAALLARQKMTQEYPMYTEQVKMSRPLFFGPLLPPRVLREARIIVQEAMQEKGYTNVTLDERGEFQFQNSNNNSQEEKVTPQALPRLNSLPPEVQNLVGAIRMYGFGLSAFPADNTAAPAVTTIKSSSDGESKAETETQIWKGTSYLSTFQPVFGDTARMVRKKNGVPPHAEVQEQQQQHEQSPQSQQQQQQEEENEKEDDREKQQQPLGIPGGGRITKNYRRKNKNPDASSISSAATTAASTASSSAGSDSAPMTETEKANMSFLANINMAGTGGMDTMTTSPPPSPKAKESIEDVAPPANNEINMFSMWARGEGAEESSTSMNGDDSKKKIIMDDGNDSVGSFTTESQQKSAAPSSSSTKPASEETSQTPKPMSDQDLFSQWARGDTNNDSSGNNESFTNASFVIPEPKSTLVKKPLANNSTNNNNRFDFQIPDTNNIGGTFQRIPTVGGGNDSDDDSIVGSELKRQVGVNEHLDAALASLVDDGPTGQPDHDDNEKNSLLTDMMRTKPGGRPLSNLELSNGCVPIYGIDDSPLPVEGDLGIHETKNDEQRTMEQNRSQEIIDKYVGPNIFGPVACPNPATGPDDSHSWNSRAAPSQRYSVGSGHGLAIGPNLSSQQNNNDSMQSPRPPAGPSRKSTRQSERSPKLGGLRTKQSNASSAATPISRTKSKGSSAGGSHVGGPSATTKRGGRFNSRHRYGWWSIPEDVETTTAGTKGSAMNSSDHSVQSGTEENNPLTTAGNAADDDPIQLPPLYHPSYNLQIDTRLQPSPETMREENLPLSDLHAATSFAHSLPYLSDRPPSYRYLQIDTQAVGFPPLGGEIEPLFCSLAIYNVETIGGGANDPNSTPMPDLQRCGRVTEVLNFDVVSDRKVEDCCIGSLWPFFASSTMTPPSVNPDAENAHSNASLSANPSLQGTRCGVFPLPSNLNVANLYAVLIVHKVLSEDADFEVYLKQSKSSRSAGGIDINKFRAKAEKASNQHGSFLMPFAFGVAPLLQVFGADNPIVASSRAVQIPLFRFSAGQGERQIIDHIMVMLYPRADFRANGIGGPAAVTNGGTAMLVMRNFGYLGLHAVVHSRSSLARDRLVDFTGELQIRRRNESDAPAVTETVVTKEDNEYVVPEWHSQFISEPAVNGGRNSVDPFGGSSKSENFDDNPSRSPLYAQELAPVPLSPVPFSPPIRPSTHASPRVRAPVNRGDIEPYYHSSFCNELLCHPRLLHNCPKGNIVMKVELREMEWKQEHGAFIAHLPRHGPSVHNSRRGPFLIQSTYTSCAVRSSDPHFLDEVKVKLPLELKPGRRGTATRTLSLFFSVYHVKFSSKNKWSKKLPLRGQGKMRDSAVSGVKDVNDATGERSETGEEGELNGGRCKLVLLSAGFLPVTSQTCLIDNGLHDVKMMYKARPPTPEMREKGNIAASSLIVTEKNEAVQRDSQASSVFDPRDESSTPSRSSRPNSEAELFGDDTESNLSDGLLSVEERILTSDALSQAEASEKSKSQDQMTLQIRIVVHSSLHAQNAILSDFLQNESDRTGGLTEKSATEMFNLSRDEIIEKIGSSLLSPTRLQSPEEERLVNSVLSLSKPQFCATSEISKHLLRVVSKLWKTLVMGTGEADLSWANPAALMPLRVHAFGSLLQVIANASLFMSKSGVTQVDGVSKFDLVTLGRVLSLIFDEGAIFGRDAKEIVENTDLRVKPPKKKGEGGKTGNSDTTAQKDKPKRRRRHQRSNFELYNDTPQRAHSVDMSDPTSSLADLFGPTSIPAQTNDVGSFSDTTKSGASPEGSASTTSSSNQGIETTTVSDLDFSDLLQANASKPNVKVDSVSDFRSNLEIGLQNEESSDGIDSPLTASNVNSLMQKFGGLSGAGKKRWMTAPAPGLATIREDSGDEGDVGMTSEELAIQPTLSRDEPKDELDSEMMVQPSKGPSKKFRIPRVKGKAAPSGEFSLDSIADSAAQSDHRSIGPLATVLERKESEPRAPPVDSVVPGTDEEILAAGGAFLDSIGQSLGLSQDVSKPPKDAHKHRKTNSFHRKTRSRCSIDWTLLGEEPDDDLYDTVQEKIDLSEPKTELPESSDEDDDTMATLHLEEENCIRLPDYVDRLVTLGQSGDKQGRWFPYMYEVVIMMWSSFLLQQRDSGDKAAVNAGSNAAQSSAGAAEMESNLAEAASSAQRVAIACAPLLFEVIKQSLGYRVKMLAREIRKADDKRKCTPLAVLDGALQSTLEKLISVITDACLDSRNFDSRDVRQMSIDVNDTIVRFLRDMFAILEPRSAYRLVMVYFSRFVTKEGKQWQDRDSSIGLRCSWEITKLRLNAMTALIRFPDFLRVCSPQMNNWGSKWNGPHSEAQDNFFDEVLNHFKRLELSDFASDTALRNSSLSIPAMRPHWLAEVLTEVCLHGTEHAEQYIQQRAGSLLHELFWTSSQQSIAKGTSQIVASMYVTFLEKVLYRAGYLSNFAPKSQLRKDILPCVLFVLQSAPTGLLRAQWRKLCTRSQGKGNSDRFGGIGMTMFADIQQPGPEPLKSAATSTVKSNEPDVLDMFTLLNMALSTVEYEGCEGFLESDGGGGGENDDQLLVWHKEYLLTQGSENQQPFMSKRQNQQRGNRLDSSSNLKGDKGYFSSGSRKWQAHDASAVIIKCGNQIVSELSHMLQSSEECQVYLNQARRSSVRTFPNDQTFTALKKDENFRFSRSDTVYFVRAATSLYLHALALRQSDIVLVRTFKMSADLVKIFGIKMFLEAVGETLQHWMRVVSLHCGARRAKVRIEATDFLELILRCTWESFGSFFRIRVPLLAVQTEVMERISAIALSRYFREERRKGTRLDNFSNASAEASLAPLWRTLDRLHHQPASQNVAFRGALIRLAVKLKKLLRAYIAARALSYLNGIRSPTHTSGNGESGKGFSDTDPLVRAYRITVLRVINASAAYSKQFLGFHGTSLSNSTVGHYEAVEDAFLDAADVFSPTELPEHRVAWLQMLADFHITRSKYAEEATCHFQIHTTLKQASALHGSLWSNTPFLPWTNSPPDPVHMDGEGPAGNALDYTADFDFEEGADGPYGRHGDDINSSRRIFYRVANSVRANTEDWETGLSKTLFCGVTFATEYSSVSSWITLREMEEKMVEEAEYAGDLFLRAGIIESSRFAWNLATQYYSEKFSYGKLANAYGCLARAVVSQVPPIDVGQQQEVSISLGRFYRVWFHGGAPDELIGAEFVYRTASGVKLEQFGEQLREVIKCIIPDRTPIHLVLDGRADESSQRNYGGFSRLGPAPLEPVRIKVTPLRPLFANGSKVRGLPEWFHRYIDEAMAHAPTRHQSKRYRGGSRAGPAEEVGQYKSPGHRGNNLSFSSSASVFASNGSSASGSLLSRRSSLSRVADGNRGGTHGSAASAETDLVGVDKFGFLQPVHHKDRIRGNKDWWKPASGDFTQKSLKVTQLQVGQSFPACVTRQAVVHRVVFTLSPLQAGVDSVCQWCSVLFRTAVATNGQAVLGTNADPGIGTDASKVVADCIHSSRVKEMGQALLKKASVASEDFSSDLFQSADRLGDDEVIKYQNKLARAIVVFLELLHLLIARNRDLLLNVIQERRKETHSVPAPSGSMARAQSHILHSNPRSLARPGSFDGMDPTKDRMLRSASEEVMRSRPSGDDRSRSGGTVTDDQSQSNASLAGGAGAGMRCDSAIALQSELQRAFISLTKSLYPGISLIMQGDTPRWLKQCSQENYFSLGNYKQTRLPIGEEVCFSVPSENFHPVTTDKADHGLGIFPLTGDQLGDHRSIESPSASVASSIYSRNSGSFRQNSNKSDNPKHEF